ncbi:MAG: OB-fold nucleic acid binding domain-containing protein, partial [Bacteroidales bacterium]
IGREMVMGGMVTNIREGMTKTGNPFGIMTLEDFSGAVEIPFFGKDYMNYRQYLIKGLFLLIRGRMEPRRFKQDEYEMRIGTIDLMSEVKDVLIQKITVSFPIESLTKSMVKDMSAFLDDNEGSVELYFEIIDHHHDSIIPLRSKTKRITVTKQFLDYLKMTEEISYKIN